MKHLLLILGLILSIDTYSQSKPIDKVLLLLPDGLISNLTIMDRQTILEKKKFYPSDNTEESITVFELRDNDKYNDRLSLRSSFETGQTLNGITELRIFFKTNGDTIVILSSYGGTNGLVEQLNLYTFSLKNETLINQENLLPENIPIKDFFKPNTPDSIFEKYGGYNYCYDLIYAADNTVEFSIDFRWNQYKDSWLLGYTFIFKWINDKFEKEIKLEEN